jgi:anaerobic ribonucleoside-triphosphate reductase activating protein
MNDKQINLAGIAQQSMVNGVGLRKVYFGQGCRHHCKNCFNPETWPSNGGFQFNMDELIDTVNQETYLDGVTFSGGDPLEQPDKFAYMAKKLKENN